MATNNVTKLHRQAATFGLEHQLTHGRVLEKRILVMGCRQIGMAINPVPSIVIVECQMDN